MSAVVIDPQETARQRRSMHRFDTLRRYSDKQKAAVLVLYRCVMEHGDTGGGTRCAKLLLGLYNGPRFPFDLTDLRALDDRLYVSAMEVLDMDARKTWCEIHVLLDAMLGEGSNAGALFENWAYNLKLRGRCKKENLPPWPQMPAIPARSE